MKLLFIGVLIIISMYCACYCGLFMWIAIIDSEGLVLLSWLAFIIHFICFGVTEWHLFQQIAEWKNENNS